MQLTNKEVLIIGGSSGIGLATAQAAQEAGAKITIAGRSRDRLETARQTFRDPAAVRVFSVDLGAETSVRELFAQTGSLDHIVITAADARYALIADSTVEDMQLAIHSKLLGGLLVAKHGARKLAPTGSLTFTSGIAAERPAPRGAVIAAVNGGLNSLAKALALELAPVRVNAVSPGWVNTPIWERAIGPDRVKLQAAMAARLPVRRIAQPNDIAQAILFLLTIEFTTGSVLQVDGGHPLV